jgi:hypothetical protein
MIVHNFDIARNVVIALMPSLATAFLVWLRHMSLQDEVRRPFRHHDGRNVDISGGYERKDAGVHNSAKR